MQTEDRGVGLRATRSFEARQIIVEYTGEIITQEESERRMCEDYKKNMVSVMVTGFFLKLTVFYRTTI